MQEDVGALHRLADLRRRHREPQRDAIVETQIAHGEQHALALVAVANDLEHGIHAAINQRAQGEQRVLVAFRPDERTHGDDPHGTVSDCPCDGCEAPLIDAREDHIGLPRVEPKRDGLVADRLAHTMHRARSHERLEQGIGVPGRDVRADPDLRAAAADDHRILPDRTPRKCIDRGGIPLEVDDVWTEASDHPLIDARRHGQVNAGSPESLEFLLEERLRL